MGIVTKLKSYSTFESLVTLSNNDFRNITGAFCLDSGQWRTNAQQRNIFKDISDSYSGNNTPHYNTFSGYSKTGFIPAGFAQAYQRRGDERAPYYFKLTKQGEEFLRPAAAKAIDASCEFNMSIWKVLKSNTGKSSYSPVNKAKILMELENQKKGIRAVDLSKKINIGYWAIYRNLRELKKIDFIDYDSLSCEIPNQITYHWVDGEIDEIGTINSGTGKLSKLPKKVARVLMDTGESFSGVQLGKKLNYDYPLKVSTILVELEKRGFVKRDTDLKRGERDSIVKIKPNGKKFNNMFLFPIQRAIEDENFRKKEFRIELERYEDDSELRRSDCSFANSLYSKSSPFYRAKPTAERREEILEVLLDNRRMRQKDIPEAIGVSDVSLYLKQLLEQGKVEREQEGNAVFYSLATA